MQKWIILWLNVLLGITIHAQSVVVNADGTHSPVIQTGNTVVAINFDGTHAVGMVTGNMITVVDPQGMHSVGFIQGNTSSNTITGTTSALWEENARGSSLNFQSRHAEAAPNRFYLSTGKRNTQQWKPQKFRYSYVSQPALKQIASGSKHALADLKTEDHKNLHK